MNKIYSKELRMNDTNIGKLSKKKVIEKLKK